MKKKNHSQETGEPGFRRLTPQQQLWELVSSSKLPLVANVFRRLKKRDQEDLCYALIAYRRFGTKGKFLCPFMISLFELLVELIDEKIVKPIQEKKKDEIKNI